jgi:hypothetical protein
MSHGLNDFMNTQSWKLDEKICLSDCTSILSKGESENSMEKFNLSEKQDNRNEMDNSHLMQYKEIKFPVNTEGMKIVCSSIWRFWLPIELQSN